MFRKKQKRNSLLFTASMIGAGAAAYYLTKEAVQGEDREKRDQSYSSDSPLDYDLG